jgi:hypothetical protein
MNGLQMGPGLGMGGNWGQSQQPFPQPMGAPTGLINPFVGSQPLMTAGIAVNGTLLGNNGVLNGTDIVNYQWTISVTMTGPSNGTHSVNNSISATNLWQ